MTAKIATLLSHHAHQAGTAGARSQRAADETGMWPSKPWFPATRDASFEGNVTAINPAVDPNSRTFTVIAEFPNTDLALKPGMFATARILLPGDSMGLFVPQVRGHHRRHHQFFATLFHSRWPRAPRRRPTGRNAR